MENSIYIAISRQNVLKQRMNLVANNIANMNTTGFKSEHSLFLEEVVKAKKSEEPLSMVLDYGQYRSMRQGPLEYTQNPLDVALEGPAYLAVETNDGTRYTRAGSLKINNEGELVTSAGIPVLDEGGARINIPPTVQSITISETGDILTEEGGVGTLQVAEFEFPHNLKATGRGLYKTDDLPLDENTTRVVQGALEKSNVNGVMEMTEMIEVSRQYQSNQRLIQNEHDRVRSAIKKLTQV